MTSGGYKEPGQGPDDGLEDEGYDESQRAEILEVTRDGPTDGTILTDLSPDTGDNDDDDAAEDDLAMDDDEVGEEDEDVESDEDADDEDDLQEDFDADDLVEEGELDDADDKALKP